MPTVRELRTLFESATGESWVQCAPFPNDQTWVEYDAAHELVAMCQVHASAPYSMPRALPFLYNLCVRSDARGQGVARRLVQRVVAHTGALYAHTPLDTNAARFMLRLGASNVGVWRERTLEWIIDAEAAASGAAAAGADAEASADAAAEAPDAAAQAVALMRRLSVSEHYDPVENVVYIPVSERA